MSNYDNFQCVESAIAIQEYLIRQGIKGKRIKIYTGTAMGWDANIYDDLLGYAISVNGRHEGIAIIINGIEIVYDNLHPEGLTKEQWLNNLQFDSKLYLGKEFEITEEYF
ncbi:papain fold toxin domain-containing protein [Okeanomitos corallinicola TIOX110]|uniref:Papain fold toxin domain-containing protein n=1 Tax=Okeanomitos corallinicola TIOX110 TaxID=3133117 RepID=A0ABZ2V3S3_9CYAN